MNKPREYLKQLRTEKGMTLQEVALTFGISRQYYHMIENGECQKRMDLTLVQKIADLFGVTLEWVAEQEQKLIEEPEEEEST